MSLSARTETTRAKLCGTSRSKGPASAESSSHMNCLCARSSELQRSHSTTCASKAVRSFISSSPSMKAAIFSVAQICFCTGIKLDPRDSPVDKLLTHHLARAEQPVLDRAQRQAGNFDDLFVS